MKYAIAAGHQLTLEVAEDVLKLGGNAFDAAIAAYTVAFIAEPCMAGVGSGAFATIFSVNDGYKVLDFFCQTPKKKRHHSELDFFPITVDFGELQEDFHVGLGSIAVPGSVAGIYKIHELYGTIPMTELLSYAIYHAKEGVKINEFQSLDLGLLKDIFKINPESKLFFLKDDQIIKEGDTLYLDPLADFLSFMAQEGKDAFYKGEIAQKLVKDMKEKGGMLDFDDLNDYEVIIDKPLSFMYNGWKTNTVPYPSLGGALMNIYLHHMEKEKHKNSFDRKASAGILCEELKKHPENIDAALFKINPTASLTYHQSIHNGGTSHINIQDQYGNAIALTFTLGEGSGYFIPNTGIHLNNMLGESALLPDGFHSWKENERLMSMMCPTIATKANSKLIIGSGGASRIPYMMSQVLNHISNGDSLETAINKPRMHVEHNTIQCESNNIWKEQSQDFNGYKVKHWDKMSMFFGGVHGIFSHNNETEAMGDPRRWGVSKVVE